MKKFTDIGQLKDLIRAIKAHHDFQGKDENGDAIYQHLSDYPTIEFFGTTKAHGTSGAVLKHADGHYSFQSRERGSDETGKNVLSLQHDNSGFVMFMKNINLDKLFEGIVFNDYVALYGEFVGATIQKGVAVSQLPKTFIIFAIKIDDEFKDLNDFANVKNHSERVYNMIDFKTFKISIDLNRPDIAQNKIIEDVISVENKCPIGEYFGIDGVGEGIVYVGHHDGNRYTFKAKGEKHSVSKVKTLIPVDTELVENILEFIEYAVTENRLQQGISKMGELGLTLEMKNIGSYLRWVVNDVVKEETDTIVKNQLDIKRLNSEISKKAKTFYINYLNAL